MLAALACSGCLFSPPSWSPDGNELAYICAAGHEADWFPPDWPFRSTDGPAPAASARVRSQVRVWNAEKGTDKLLDETEGVFSNVAWRPDGQSLTYLRFEPKRRGEWSTLRKRLDDLPILTPDDLWDALQSPDQVEGTLALILRRRDGGKITLHQETTQFKAAHLVALPWLSPAWSPDGLLIAAPWCSPLQTLIFDFEKNEVIQRFEGTVLPSWSPNGEQLCVFRIEGRRGYAVTDRTTWFEPGLVQPVDFVNEPALWDPKGSGNFWACYQHEAISRQGPIEDPGQVQQLSVMRISSNGSFRHQVHAFNLARRTASASWLTFDPNSNSLLFCANAGGVPVNIHELHAEFGDPQRIWHPLGDEEADSPILLGGQRKSPAHNLLAYRFGIPDWSAPLALYDLKRSENRVLATNRETAVPALWVIAEATARLVRKLPPQAKSPYRVSENTFLSPRRRLEQTPPLDWTLDLFNRPKTQDEQDESVRNRIEELAGFGLEILKGMPREQSPQMQEAEIFFRYARREYQQTFDLIQAHLRQAELPPDRAAALSAVACQCAMATGNRDWARGVLRELLAERSKRLSRTEDVNPRRELQLLGIGDDRLPLTGKEEFNDPLFDRLRSLWDQVHLDVPKPEQTK